MQGGRGGSGCLWLVFVFKRLGFWFLLSVFKVVLRFLFLSFFSNAAWSGFGLRVRV